MSSSPLLITSCGATKLRCRVRHKPCSGNRADNRVAGARDWQQWWIHQAGAETLHVSENRCLATTALSTLPLVLQEYHTRQPLRSTLFFCLSPCRQLLFIICADESPKRRSPATTLGSTAGFPELRIHISRRHRADQLSSIVWCLQPACPSLFSRPQSTTRATTTTTTIPAAHTVAFQQLRTKRPAQDADTTVVYPEMQGRSP